MSADYTEDNIKSLDWKEHIRLRPGMYIGKLGDGSSSDDGIYILLKEVIDNSIDEFVMGHGKIIEVNIDGTHVAVRDFGRGILCLQNQHRRKIRLRSLQKIRRPERRRYQSRQRTLL